MSTKKFLALAILPSIFLACGPSPEKDSSSADAPKITGGVLGEVSPFDTLDVEFTTAIAQVSADQVDSDKKLKWESDGDVLRLFGDSVYSSGFAMFLPGKTYSVTFNDLESDEGEVQDDPQILMFETMMILDKDNVDSKGNLTKNDDRVVAEAWGNETATKFMSGKTLDEGESVAGLIQGESFSKYDDFVDWFSIWLNATDTLEIGLSHLNDDLDVVFLGPANGVGDLYDGWPTMKSNTGTKSESFKVYVDLNAQKHGVDKDLSKMDIPLQYWIGVKKGAGFKLKSSYVLSATRFKEK